VTVHHASYSGSGDGAQVTIVCTAREKVRKLVFGQRPWGQVCLHESRIYAQTAGGGWRLVCMGAKPENRGGRGV